jgi:hypothetical protein
MARVDPHLANQLYSAYRAEFDEELSFAALQNNGQPLSEQQLEDICGRLVLRHSAELYNGQLTADGVALDTSELAPDFVNRLANAGATHESARAIIAKLYPSDSPAIAMRKWRDAARKIPPRYDLKSGTVDGEEDDGTFYVPGKSRSAEGG